MQEEAEAIRAVAVTAGKVIDAAVEVGRFFGKVFGTIPQDAVGLVVGDFLHEVRIRNIHKLEQRTEEILSQRVDPHIQSVSPTLAIPLLKAAQDESRTELQELWARLLANAMDGSRSGVRKNFIETVQRLDPVDAQILIKIAGDGDLDTGVWKNDILSIPNIRRDEVLVSLNCLKDLGCIETNMVVDTAIGVKERVTFSLFGRELMRSCLL